MSSNLKKHRHDLQRLVSFGERMLVDLSLREAELDVEHKLLAEQKNICGCFERDYQLWYTEAAAAVSALIPTRMPEFEQLYRASTSRKNLDSTNYCIQDWLMGRRLVTAEAADVLLIISMQFKTQLEILRSAEARLESSLFEMRRLARADLFDSELDACRELAVNGFLRAAGAIAGVMLEKHLQEVVERHGLVVRRREPTINDYNDLLKNAGIIEVPLWRKIQRLGDIRNLCSHNKKCEPTQEDIDELIDCVERLLKMLT